MPASTRHSAAPAGQQSKLNFAAKKNVSHQKVITRDIVTRDIVYRASTPPSRPVEELKAPRTTDLDEKNVGEEENRLDDHQEAQSSEASLVHQESNQILSTIHTHKVEEPEKEELPFQEEFIEKPRLSHPGVDSEVSDKAYQITPRQIKKYYKSIEGARIRPAVHQEGLTEYEKILRHFDLSSQYGPCVGISRFKRWDRAERLGLGPPIEVLAVLLKSELGEGAEAPPKNWEPAPVVAREDVGSVAYINELIATHTD